MKKKYFTEEQRLIARRKVPETGMVHKVEKLELNNKKYNDSFLKNVDLCENIYSYSLFFLISGIILLFFIIYASILCFAISFFLYFLNRFVYRINLEYNLSKSFTRDYNKMLQTWKKLNTSYSLFQVKTRTDARERTHAGANSLLEQKNVAITSSIPYYMTCNLETISFNVDGGRMVLLPDKVLLIKANKSSFIQYSKLNFCLYYSNYIIEKNNTPADAMILNKVWKYKNVDGSPDRRFNNNYLLNKCLYGVLKIEAGNINVEFYFSNNTLVNKIDINNLKIDYIKNVKYEKTDEKYLIKLD